MVIISDGEIGSPYIRQADTLIILNNPSLGKFKTKLKSKGLCIINSSLVAGAIRMSAKILKYPFSEVALNLGNIKVANMVAAGCYLAARKTIALKHIFTTFQEIAPPDKKNLIELNQQAIYAGARLVDGKGPFCP
jgi:2-oxoglutarate ferredoxin oxidoreductase subunit gamma